MYKVVLIGKKIPKLNHICPSLIEYLQLQRTIWEKMFELQAKLSISRKKRT